MYKSLKLKSNQQGEKAKNTFTQFDFQKVQTFNKS